MKNLGSVLAIALISASIGSAPSMARELRYNKSQANVKRVLINREQPRAPIYLYGNITGAP